MWALTVEKPLGMLVVAVYWGLAGFKSFLVLFLIPVSCYSREPTANGSSTCAPTILIKFPVACFRLAIVRAGRVRQQHSLAL